MCFVAKQQHRMISLFLKIMLKNTFKTAQIADDFFNVQKDIA